MLASPDVIYQKNCVFILISNNWVESRLFSEMCYHMLW